MPELNPQPLPPVSNRVRVYVPHDALYDLEKMHTITKSILTKFGCGGCHSGRYLDFVALNEFIVNPKTLEVHEFTAPSHELINHG